MNEMERAIERAKTERETRPEQEKIREYEESLYAVRSGHNFTTLSLEQLLRIAEMTWSGESLDQAESNITNLRIFADLTKDAGIRPDQPPGYVPPGSPYPATPNVWTWNLVGDEEPPRGMNEGSTHRVRMTAEGYVLRPNYYTNDKAVIGKKLTDSMAEIVVKNGLEWPKGK